MLVVKSEAYLLSTLCQLVGAPRLGALLIGMRVARDANPIELKTLRKQLQVPPSSPLGPSVEVG